jgi:ATP-binding cassette, subfamily B, bacterial PglK
MQIIKKFLYLLTSRERKRAMLLLAMILIMALLDMIGVVSILPFMAVLTNPTLIETNLILNSMFKASAFFGVENNQQFLFILGVFVFIMLVISLTFKALTTYAQLRFVQMREYSIGKLLMTSYLRQPYSWFLSRNSADLGKTILSEVQQVIGNGLNPLMELISKSTVTIALIILLIIVDPKLALIVGLSLGSAYGFIFYLVYSFLDRIGKERLKNNLLRFTVLSEVFGATKEVKVSGLEKIYIERFSKPAQKFARHTATSQIIRQLPRFLLEVIAFGGMMIIILYLMLQTGNYIDAIPVITLYVFAGYRLMPALQGIYGSLTQLTFINTSLDSLINDLKNLELCKSSYDQSVLSFNKTITLKNIQYNYPNSSRIILKNVNLIIQSKSIIGLVGATGSGKTTIVDIILGLFEAQKGSLEIDEKIITQKNVRSWQRLVGYVPQNIFLADDTIAANIAFGKDQKDIDQKAVEKASTIANLHKFIMDELPQRYQTVIGERGVMLSGGQRQRIGIARALYNNPQVLVMDEATSALDNQTEQAVMDAVNNLSKNITIILIAHRLSTVKKCDQIFLLENGELKNKGTFSELIKINHDF